MTLEPSPVATADLTRLHARLTVAAGAADLLDVAYRIVDTDRKSVV